MAYSQAWLESNDSIRALFVVVTPLVSNVLTPTYLSTTGYITNTADVCFLPIIVGGSQVTESLSITGNTGLTFGDIEIHNTDGSLDAWLEDSTYIWTNKSIKIYYGDPSWSSTDISDFTTKFQLVFTGVVSGIDSKSKNTLNIKIRDGMERLNTPITEEKVGDVTGWTEQTTQDTIIPIVFGEVFNITPILIDPALLKYRFNLRKSERVIEIRDNGIPIYNSALTSGATINLTTSTFTLSVPPAGAITMSAQGSKTLDTTYAPNILEVISLIVQEYGNTYSKLLGSEVSLASAINPPVGLYIQDRTNVLLACQQLASSIGAQLHMSRLGILNISRLLERTTEAYTEVGTDQMILDSFAISSRVDINCSQKLGYCKNYTPIDKTVLQSIPLEHIPILNDEWLTTTSTDLVVKEAYALNAEPVQKDTLLIVESDAIAEANRLLAYYKVRKTVYKFTGTAALLSLELGKYIRVTHPRFGLQNGKIGQIIGLTPKWLDATVDVEVII